MPSLLPLLLVLSTFATFFAHAAPLPLAALSPREDYHELIQGEYRANGQGWVATKTLTVFGPKETEATLPLLPPRSLDSPQMLSSTANTPLPALLRRIVPFLQFPPSSPKSAPVMPADVLLAGLEDDEHVPAHVPETGSRQVKRAVVVDETETETLRRPTAADVGDV